MLAWLSESAATIVVSLILLAVVVLIVVRLISDKRKGKNTCGANCAHCAMAGKCHKK